MGTPDGPGGLKRSWIASKRQRNYNNPIEIPLSVWNAPEISVTSWKGSKSSSLGRPLKYSWNLQKLCIHRIIGVLRTYQRSSILWWSWSYGIYTLNEDSWIVFSDSFLFFSMNSSWIVFERSERSKISETFMVFLTHIFQKEPRKTSKNLFLNPSRYFLRNSCMEYCWHLRIRLDFTLGFFFYFYKTLLRFFPGILPGLY